MHPKTLELHAYLTDPEVSAEDKIAKLHQAYAGETAYILTCGPSLNEYSAEQLQDMLAGKLVMCIKQAYDKVLDHCDFLLLNTWNFRRYDFVGTRPIVIREYGPTDPPVFLQGDIELRLPKPSNREEQLAISHKFDDYLFSKTVDRPWGPGVLYELGFYLAQHVGVNKVVALGWDVGVANSPQMPHFYDTNSPETVRIIKQSREIDDLAERNKFLHDNHITYNRPRIIPEEVADCAAVSEHWAAWMNSHGVEVKVVSHQSLASPTIPRTRLEAEI